MSSYISLLPPGWIYCVYIFGCWWYNNRSKVWPFISTVISIFEVYVYTKNISGTMYSFNNATYLKTYKNIDIFFRSSYMCVTITSDCRTKFFFLFKFFLVFSKKTYLWFVWRLSVMLRIFGMMLLEFFYSLFWKYHKNV